MRIKKMILFCCVISLLQACSNDETTTTPQESPVPVIQFTGEIAWVYTYGGSDIDDARDVVAAHDGGYMVIGTTSSADGDITNKTGNDSDFWVLKISEEGNLLWNKTFGGSSNDKAASITATIDGNYILSGYTGSDDGDVTENNGFNDYWIIKINPLGEIIWERSFGFSGGDQASNIINTSDGGYLITGFFDVTASNGEGSDVGRNANSSRNATHGVGDYWVIKLDAEGNKIWRNFYGGSNDDRSYDLVETADGGFLIAGAAESTDFDITDNKGGHDFWLVKTNASGEKQWTKSYGGNGLDNGYAITQTTDGNYLFVGDTRSSNGDVSTLFGNADSWCIKIDGNGTIQWEKTHGGAQFESARSIANLNNGTYLISGSTRSVDGDVAFLNGQNDAWVYVIDEEGNLFFEKTIGGTELDFANSAIKSNDNAILLVGRTESNDGNILINKGMQDLLIAKVR